MRILALFVFLSLLSCKNQSLTDEIHLLKTQLKESNDLLQLEKNDETTFIHTVFIWIKNDVNESEKTAFANEGLKELITCKSIYKAYYGPPAQTPRDVVDNSYDYALVCHFKNKNDHDLYQSDPQHLAFIEKYKHLWTRVQVYDNIVNN